MKLDYAALPAILTLSLALLGASGAGATPDAVAAERTAAQMEALATLATGEVEAGEYRRAIGHFLDAYRLAPEAGSTLIYNVAYVYEVHLGELETARSFYRRFIGAAGADPGLLAEADRRLQAIGAQLAAQVEPAPAPVASPPVSRPVSRPAQVDAPMPTAALASPATPSTVAPWTLTIAGGAIALAGATLGVLAAGAHETFESDPDPAAQRDAREAGRTYALGADIGVAVGGAMLVGGVIWLLLGDDDAAPTRAVRPTPTGLSVAF